MFISNSNNRLPKLSFGKIWLVTVISLISFFLIWNWFWLSRMVAPLPDDDAKLWSYHRRRVAGEGASSVVLIGASRMLRGFDQDKFSQLTGKKTIQLAIVGESLIPVLQNLAEDESFRGTIIADFGEFVVYQKYLNQNLNAVPNEWIKDFQESKTSDDFEFWLRSYGRYLVAKPKLGNNLADALKNLTIGQGFEKAGIEKRLPQIAPTYFNRSMIFKLDELLSENELKELIEKDRITPIKAMNTVFETNRPQPSKFQEIGETIERYVQKIQSRGGRVVIVYFPISGELEKLNEIIFPRKEFWDVFANLTSARTIHYKDYPTLSKFICPDGSHLNAQDTAEFTENLTEIISKKDTK